MLRIPLIAVVSCLPSLAVAAGTAELRLVSFDDRGDATRMVIATTETPTFTAYTLAHPDRVVLDFPSTRLAGGLGDRGTLELAPESWVVSGATAQQLDDRGQLVRVVLTLARPAGFEVTASGDRVVVTVTPRGEVATVERAKQPDERTDRTDAAELVRLRDEIARARREVAMAKAEVAHEIAAARSARSQAEQRGVPGANERLAREVAARLAEAVREAREVRALATVREARELRARHAVGDSGEVPAVRGARDENDPGRRMHPAAAGSPTSLLGGQRRRESARDAPQIRVQREVRAARNTARHAGEHAIREDRGAVRTTRSREVGRGHDRLSMHDAGEVREAARVNDIAYRGRNGSGELEIAIAGDVSVTEGRVTRTYAELILDGVELGTSVAGLVERKLDVTEYGSPVRTITAYRDSRVAGRVYVRIELVTASTPKLVRHAGGIRWHVDENAAS